MNIQNELHTSIYIIENCSDLARHMIVKCDNVDSTLLCVCLCPTAVDASSIWHRWHTCSSFHRLLYDIVDILERKKQQSYVAGILLDGYAQFPHLRFRIYHISHPKIKSWSILLEIEWYVIHAGAVMNEIIYIYSI